LKNISKSQRLNPINIIAETAFSHEGEFKYLLNQIDHALAANADYIKFQIFINVEDSYVSLETIKKINTWVFTKKLWREALLYANKQEIKVICLPGNLSSLDFCFTCNDLIDIYEIHSVNFCDRRMSDKLNSIGKPVILGVGGRYPQEIDEVIHNLKNCKIILMIGFQSFPTEIEKVELLKIRGLKQIYDCEIGYADHTSFLDNYSFNIMDTAYAYGARYFEKHLVCEMGEKRIDYESAVGWEQFIELRERINKTIAVSGSGNIFKLNEKEIAYRKREMTWVYRDSYDKDHKIITEDITLKISDEKSDFSMREIQHVYGRRLVSDVTKDEAVKYGQIGEANE
jgi:N,N'-diacetyllegionaminate synthase